MTMNTIKKPGLIQNRFAEARKVSTRGATVAPAADQRDREVLRFSAREFAAFSAHNNQVFAEALSVEEGYDMFRAALEIRSAPDFTMAFTEKVLRNPLLRELFLHWITAVRNGAVPPNGEARKLSSGNQIFSLIEVQAWLATVDEAMKKLKAAQAETPINVAALGLEVIDRKAEILKHAATPLASLAPTLQSVATTPGLDAATQRYFYGQIAEMAIAHVMPVDKRTPSDYASALTWLRSAVTGLSRADGKETVIDQTMREAIRIAKECDAPLKQSNEQIKTNAILLDSTDPKVVASGERAADAHRLQLMEMALEAQMTNVPLATPALSDFQALVEASSKSKTLLLKMPDLIEAITVHPALRPEAPDRPQVPPYQASAEMINMQVTLTVSLLKNIAIVYPQGRPVDEAHKDLVKKIQVLVAKSFALLGDQGPSLTLLVRELTRHPDLAIQAAEFVKPEWISNQTQRLDACQNLVVSALENGQVDAAKQHFDTRFAEDDGKNRVREATIMATAAELVNRRRGDIEGSDPAVMWVSNAHTQGITAALKTNPPEVAAAKRILTVMATDYEDWALDARGSLALVDQVLSWTNLWPNYLGLHPQLVRVLARHEGDEACMEKAKGLIQTLIENVSVHTEPLVIAANGGQFNWRMDESALEMLQVLGSTRKLSGFVMQLAEAFVAHQPLADNAGAYATTVAKLKGPPSLREKLAYVLTDAMLQPLSDDQLAMVALAWAGAPETHQRARELIVKFNDKHAKTELNAIDADVQTAYIKMEGAVRLAVPGLMTEKTASDLFAGFRSANRLVRPETIEQAAKYMPRDLIDRILGNVDYAEAAEIIQRGHVKPEEAPAAATDAAATPAT